MGTGQLSHLNCGGYRQSRQRRHVTERAKLYHLLLIQSQMTQRRPYRRLRVCLTDDDRQQVTALLRSSREPARVLKRVEILNLLDKGEPVSTVSRLLDVSPTTVRNIGHRYIEMGLEGAIYDRGQSRDGHGTA